MQTDRELIELAAKAAGIQGRATENADEFNFWLTKPDRFGGRTWAPILDDGDALRLEIALKLTSSWEPRRGWWSIGGIVNGEYKWLAFHEDRKRATTMAAAEIGKSMCNK